jgi:putative transposase
MCRILPRTEKSNCVIFYKRLGVFAKLATTYAVGGKKPQRSRWLSCGRSWKWSYPYGRLPLKKSWRWLRGCRSAITGPILLIASDERPRAKSSVAVGLVVQMAKENRSWGYDRLAGALAHLGYEISDQTVGNILKRRGLLPAPDRKKTTTWKEFIRSHMDVLVATDFFTTEVWTLGGLVTFYVLFFIELGSRRVHIAGVTPHPHEQWMIQMARNITMDQWGFLGPGLYLIHDRDTKFCAAFKQMLDDAGVNRVPLPPRSPHLNTFAERFVRSVKEEALSRFILFGERALWHVLKEYMAHYHEERPHQGKGNVILFPSNRPDQGREGAIQCHERLGGLLNYYDWEAA